MTETTNDKREGRRQATTTTEEGRQRDPSSKYTTPSFTCHITLMMPPPPSPELNNNIRQTSAPCPRAIARGVDHGCSPPMPAMPHTTPLRTTRHPPPCLRATARRVGSQVQPAYDNRAGRGRHCQHQHQQDDDGTQGRGDDTTMEGDDTHPMPTSTCS
jgi:hypothetical protein